MFDVTRETMSGRDCCGPFAGSMPQSQYFSTNRVVDPLAPVYPLPKAEIVPAVSVGSLAVKVFFEWGF